MTNITLFYNNISRISILVDVCHAEKYNDEIWKKFLFSFIVGHASVLIIQIGDPFHWYNLQFLLAYTIYVDQGWW